MMNSRILHKPIPWKKAPSSITTNVEDNTADFTKAIEHEHEEILKLCQEEEEEALRSFQDRLGRVSDIRTRLEKTKREFINVQRLQQPRKAYLRTPQEIYDAHDPVLREQQLRERIDQLERQCRQDAQTIRERNLQIIKLQLTLSTAASTHQSIQSPATNISTPRSRKILKAKHHNAQSIKAAAHSDKCAPLVSTPDTEDDEDSYQENVVDLLGDKVAQLEAQNAALQKDLTQTRFNVLRDALKDGSPSCVRAALEERDEEIYRLQKELKKLQAAFGKKMSLKEKTVKFMP